MSDVKKEREKKLSVRNKLKTNFWVVGTLFFGILSLVLVLIFFSGKISENRAGEIILEVARGQLGDSVTLLNVEPFGNDFYAVTLSYQGQEPEIFITKDGKNLVGGITPMDSLRNTQVRDTQVRGVEGGTSYSPEDLVKLERFSTCLAERGIRIYGADWCGWTKRLVDTLGGFDVMGDVYVQCQGASRGSPGAGANLCEGITGFPTIKLNGEVYSGARTLEALGGATGCEVPELGRPPVVAERPSSNTPQC